MDTIVWYKKSEGLKSMEFVIEQEKIVKELTALSSYVLGSNAFMQQDNFKFKTSGKKIQVSSYNGENSILFELDGEVLIEGELVTPGKILSSLILNLQTGKLNFKKDDHSNQLLVTGSNIEYNFPLVNEGDWLDVLYSEEETFIMPSKTLIKNINKVTKAAATRDNQRPLLEGTLFVIDNTDITLAATDAFRMCIRSFEHHGVNFQEEYGCIVHSKTLDILSKLIKLECTEDVSVKIAFEKGKRVYFEVENMFLIVAPILGEREKFPDWKRFIPKQLAVDVLIDRKEFVESHKRESLFIENQFKEPVILTFEASGMVNLHVGPTIYGEADEDLTVGEVKVFNNDKPYRIGLNTSFLQDGVSIIDNKNIRMRTTPEDGMQLIMLTESNEELNNLKNFYIAMPLRFK